MTIRGVYAPVPTPFTEADELDIPSWRSNVARWMTTPLHGLVVLGTNGEAPLVDDDEADRLVAEARGQMPRERLLIAGTGRQSTRATIRASRRAAEAGADAVLVRTPSYFRGQMTREAFVPHYHAVADGSPVPVLLYNFTALTGVTLPVDVVATLAAHPNIIGLKESGPDLSYVGDLIAVAPEGFSVLVGSASTFFASLTLGAAGGVMAAACVAPDECVQMYELVNAGRFDEARRVQRRVTPLAKQVTTVHGIPGLKAALAQLGYVGGPPRPPLRPVSREADATIRQHVEQFAAATVAG
ncbi:MAG: dihydrodipicolinate synthase family protein [Acidobacteriota bacterium]|nr:dihydrodipicolinate synthase family protein [Acidobacteriota bacterium]